VGWRWEARRHSDPLSVSSSISTFEFGICSINRGIAVNYAKFLEWSKWEAKRGRAKRGLQADDGGRERWHQGQARRELGEIP
jgi:hypothetical protein